MKNKIENFVIYGKKRHLKAILGDLKDLGYKVVKDFWVKPDSILITNDVPWGLYRPTKDHNVIACFDSSGYGGTDNIFQLPKDYNEALTYLEKRIEVVNKHIKKNK